MSDDLERSLEDCLHARDAEREEWLRFLYAAGHDLQEPLRSISGFTELLRRHCPGDPEATELTSYIIDSVKRMTTLVQDVQVYARAGAAPKRSVVSLNAIVQWAMLNLDPLMRESSARIVCGPLPEASVDESEFVQLFQHLLSNAIKYRGPEPPEINISANTEDGASVISVGDNGPGIEPRYHQQIFAPFKRLHAREISGSGLGLALCRKIIEAHGGRIWVESDGQHGSLFKFTLPTD
jgi:light-regulated signal transduction histidine kinase (bacteriophytochrome)